MIKILSIENWDPLRSWSWGLVIERLIWNLPQNSYEFVRIRRGEFKCQNPKCHRIFSHPVETELCDHFNILFPQNVDTIRMIPKGEHICTRIGGLDMRNPATERYAKDFERVAHIVATNRQLYEIAKTANSNCTIIPNGVDLDFFKPPTPNPNFDRKFMIGFAGNIWGGGADYKGWMYYVKAATRLTIDGVEQRHLLHNSNQIPNAHMPEKFYHLIDALILPSRNEGCSNVVTEALACGVPCLLTRVGFHGEMLKDEKNCLFIERDEDSIIEAVRRLLKDPDLRTRLAVNGRKFAEEHHDVRNVAAEYDRIFQSILARNARKEGQ